MSQAELGRLVGEKQQSIAFWEQSEKPPRSDVLPKMAKILGVSVEEILDAKNKTSGQRRRPVGKTQKLFEEVAKLPRRQEEKIVEVISAMVEQYQRKTD
ncbi:MAG: helix-turn-helix transcriptional regulator [Myxococcales bacterium]|nr:helix-turn-helix transcriptional regulator [Myxococcales bacterium]